MLIMLKESEYVFGVVHFFYLFILQKDIKPVCLNFNGCKMIYLKKCVITIVHILMKLLYNKTYLWLN